MIFLVDTKTHQNHLYEGKVCDEVRTITVRKRWPEITREGLSVVYRWSQEWSACWDLIIAMILRKSWTYKERISRSLALVCIWWGRAGQFILGNHFIWFWCLLKKPFCFVLSGWPPERVTAMYCFLKTTRRRSTGLDTLLPS